MLIPTLIIGSEKRVRFEEPTTDPQPQQTPQRTPKRQVSDCMQPQWCDVRRDYNGRKIIVAHKGPCYGNGPNANGGGKGGTEDVKKGSNGNGNGNGGAKNGEKKDEAKAGDGGNGGDKKEGGGGDEKPSNDFTPEEDEKLNAMKAEGKSWAEITAELGKPKGVLQPRWKAINADNGGGGGGKKGGGGGDGKKKNGGNGGEKKEEPKPAEEKKDEEPKKLTKAQKRAAKQEENAKNAEAAKADATAKPNGGGGKGEKPASKPASKADTEARFTMNEWVTLQEDDLFSFGELQLLSELIAQYDTGRWQMVASRFFDKTGRRVHADDVRDKFLGALG